MKHILLLALFILGSNAFAKNVDIYNPDFYKDNSCTWRIKPAPTNECGRGFVAGQAECKEKSSGAKHRLPLICPHGESATPLKCLNWTRKAGDGSCIPAKNPDAAARAIQDGVNSRGQ